MVQLMLNGFGGDARKSAGISSAAAKAHGVECYHVNARVSKELDDIGGVRIGKLLLLLRYCAEAIWCRFRYGVTTFYYIPAPGKRSALYRDWLVMLFCRPFFRKVILHWHAAGLAHWLETHEQMRTRVITFSQMREVDLSIVVADYNRADPAKLMAKKIRVVYNGIPDPCPDFDQSVRPRREARLAARRKLAEGGTLGLGDLAQTGRDPQVFKVLYLAHCTRQKGVFDALAGFFRAREILRATGSALSLQLTVAGSFTNQEEQSEFNRLVVAADCVEAVSQVGFVAGAAKLAVLREADVFCFPTYHYAESFGLVLAEALAFGLPILTTQWRALPEVLPPGYPGLVPIRAPEQIAKVLLTRIFDDSFLASRRHFESNFTIEKHLDRLSAAIRSVDTDQGAAAL